MASTRGKALDGRYELLHVAAAKPRSRTSTPEPGSGPGSSPERVSFSPRYRTAERSAFAPPVPEHEIIAQNKRRWALTLLYVALWYVFSISLSVYNKWMLSPNGLDFPFPVMTTALHQLVMLGLAALLMKIRQVDVQKYSLPDYVRQVIPCALASAGDIGLGNTSLRVVSLSFYTMVKSSAISFVLIFSVLCKVERPSWLLVANIAAMSLGVFAMCSGETSFDEFGFVLVLSAAACSGLRWALTKLLLINHFRAGHPHPVQTILLLAPVMFVVLMSFGLVLESLPKFIGAALWQDHHLLVAFVYLLLPGVLAFCMTLSEFQLLHITGPLALAVAGICKEVATILVSVLVFGDRISFFNGVGILITIAAIFGYHYLRMKEEAENLQLRRQRDVESGENDDHLVRDLSLHE